MLTVADTFIPVRFLLLVSHFIGSVIVYQVRVIKLIKEGNVRVASTLYINGTGIDAGFDASLIILILDYKQQ